MNLGIYPNFIYQAKSNYATKTNCHKAMNKPVSFTSNAINMDTELTETFERIIAKFDEGDDLIAHAKKTAEELKKMKIGIQDPDDGYCRRAHLFGTMDDSTAVGIFRSTEPDAYWGRFYDIYLDGIQAFSLSSSNDKKIFPKKGFALLDDIVVLKTVKNCLKTVL